MPQTPPLLAMAACLRRGRASRSALDRYRNECLQKLVSHAALNIPFYQRQWAEAGVDVSAIRTVADLSQLPAIDRLVLRSEPRRNLLAPDIPSGEMLRHRTGGTGGHAFEMVHTRRELNTIRWIKYRVFHDHGRRGGDKIVRVWRDAATPRRSRPSRKILDRMGLFLRGELSWPQNPASLAEALLRAVPSFLEGPPAALLRAGAILGQDGISRLGVRRLFTEGEWLSAASRRALEQDWSATVAEIYGCTELYVVAWTCARCGLLHTCDDSVIVEVLREDGQLALPGERGEVVATALHGFALPMIRYRTGDLVIQGDSVAPCGRPLGSLARILGRMADLISIPGAPPLHPSDMDAVFAHAPWVREFQLAVIDPTHVEVRVIPRRAVLEDERLRIERLFQERLGYAMRGVVRIVDDIPLGTAEKFPLVVRL